MFKSVTVTNYRGDSLELPLEWPNDAGLLISSIDGITPGNVQVNSQDFAILDGGVYNSSRMQTRNITIEFYYGFNPHIESSRHLAYQYFPVKTQVRLDFLTDERYLSIWGYVEGNETNIFSEQEKGQVSIICPDPYFYEQSPVIYELGSFIHEFEFPFSNESLEKPLICFSDYGDNQIYTLTYDGDIEVGVLIKVQFIKDPTIHDLTIYDMSNNQELNLNFDDIEKDSGVEIQQYGTIVINSIRGEKDIYYERFGVRKSILGVFDAMNFPWFYISPGKNQIVFDLKEEYLDDVKITIEYRGAYGGV